MSRRCCAPWRGGGAEIELFRDELRGGAAAQDSERFDFIRCLQLLRAIWRRESRSASRQMSRSERPLKREGPFSLVYERHSLWSFAAMEYAPRERHAGIA